MIDKSKLSKEEREQLENYEKAISMSRWNPDTHLRSIHGKPVWHAYGQGNRKPTVGGIVYGQYMLSHNINPESGDNIPYYRQVYDSAHNIAFENGKPRLIPTKEIPIPVQIPPEQLEELKNRNPIMPNNPSKDLKRHVVQLDLLQEPWFASKHSTPAPSEIAITENDESAESIKIKSPISKELKTTQKNETQKSKQPSKSQVRAPFNAKSLNVAPQVVLNAKDSRIKDIGSSTKGASANMKTMASTGNFENKEIKQTKPDVKQIKSAIKQTKQEEKPVKQEEKPVKQEEIKIARNIEPSEKSLIPLPMTNPFSQFHPKSEEKEVELLDDNIDDNEDEAIENEDPNQSHEINPTVFPVGFPFWFCPSSDHKITLHDKDPRSYQFVPSCWTKRIPPAGKCTFKGEPVYSIVLGNPQV